MMKKLVSMILIVCILGIALPMNGFKSLSIAEENNLITKNSLHFIIQHWHDVPDETDDSESEQLIDVVEGYIAKNNENKYDFYYVDETNGETKKITGNLTEISPYIENIDTETGIITLSIKPITNEEGVALERFSGISLSAGHGAIDSSKEDTIEITYQPNVHLVKAQVYYSNEGITVFGSGRDDAVFGNSDIQQNLEQDTEWVYTYKKDKEPNKKGDVVKDINQKPVYNKEDLPKDLVEGEDVQKVKVYSTLAGLHTDKTVTAVDGRTFNVDLESWFSGAPTANIGLILDSSGSMAFSSDELKPININELGLSEEQKEKLSEKILKEGRYVENPTADTWSKEIFLTNEEVNSILNIYNTDDSKLSASDYSYYVFDERDSVNEYVALGYWDGSLKDLRDKIIGYYQFNRGTSEEPDERDWLINSATGQSAKLVNQVKNNEQITFTDAPLPDNWQTDPRIKMDGENGLKIKNINDGVGVLLDAVPSSSNFSVSFSIKKDGKTDDTADPQNYTDILYIGEIENKENSEYFRAIRDGRNGGSVSTQGNSSARFKGFNNEVINDNKVSDINTVFSSANTAHTITLVFNEGKLTTYMDGEIAQSKNTMTNTDIPVNLTGNNIVLNGFNDGYNGADLFIDNVVVIDAPLSKEEVQELESIVNEEDDKSEYIIYNKYNNNGEFKSIGSVANNFVGLTKGLPGWYYVNYDSEWDEKYFNKDIESCKKYWGIPTNTKEELIFEDTITADRGIQLKNTGYTYEPEENTPTQFYIDEDGYLRCFFASGTRKDVIGTSLVFFKEDNQHIKAEILQRAIGNFALQLNDVSPDSKVSAVRFSTTKVTEQDYDKLVLLDWTNDVGEVQSMMSLNRGTGGTREGTPSKPREGLEPITQYNYGITGGTATYTGLKSFYQHLSTRVDQSADKYLVIFTDGKDTSQDKRADAISVANSLKEAGYTIFSVMLTGGSVEKSEVATSEYQQAKSFLLQLIGTSNPDENKENYFFSTLEGSKSIDSLTQIFTETILKRVTYNLADYTVKDYIDPRFDLVSSNGNIYHLNADGNVVIENKEGTVEGQYNVKDEPIMVALSNNYVVDVEARKAELHYSDDMYYLVWKNQIIPGCTVNAKRLPVWNAQLTLRAKDDFIGGNAILTNGNLEKMNVVYHEGDNNYSSGVEDVYIKDGDNYPSKGFPRVAANVSTEVDDMSKTQYIYLGETLSQVDASEKLWENAYNELEGTSKNYLEYLERYALKNNETLADYQDHIMNGEKIRVPYYYIKNAENSNQTGGSKYEADLLGYLEYEMLPENLVTYPEDGIVKDKDTRKMILTVTYVPLNIEQTQGQEESRAKQNSELVTDSDYHWNEKYKPAQGDIVDEETVNGDYITNQVSGEIALQLKLGKDVQSQIVNNELTYQIDLMRSFGETKEKVGTFKAVCKKDNLSEPDNQGNVYITADIEYNDENQFMKQYGLPIGTYTLENPVVTNGTDVKLDGPKVIKDSKLYTDGIFTVGTDAENAQNYIALLGEDNTVTLGAKDEEREYTDYRFGLLQVVATKNVSKAPNTKEESPSLKVEETPSTNYELPKTGNNSLVILLGIAGILAIIGIAAEIYGRKK